LARFVKIQASVKADLMLSYRTLTSYPEIGETLDRLRDANYRTGILSNGETAMLNDAVSSALIADRLDHVWSVDAVRLYKPHPRVYEMATAGFGLNANEICLISSNRWDVAGATAFGMKAIWVNRADNPPEYGGLPPIAMLGNLTELHAKLV
jgi:2-haloacid dehalogenase